MSFDISEEMNIKMIIFCSMTLCSLLDRYQHSFTPYIKYLFPAQLISCPEDGGNRS
jgi:hypothetical protein